MGFVTRVGICEDDESVLRVLTDALRMNDHVIIIDIGLPDADGRDVCQALRAEGQHAPVLFLTALDGVHDRVAGFHAGGDDYVVKPFAISEILVRLEALLKRTRPEPVAVSHLHPDPDRFALRTESAEQKLTPTEFRLIAALAAKPAVVVSSSKPSIRRSNCRLSAASGLCCSEAVPPQSSLADGLVDNTRIGRRHDRDDRHGPARVVGAEQ